MNSNGVLKDKARLLLKGNWGTAIIIFIIVIVVNILINFIGGKVSSIQTFFINFSTTSILSILIAPLKFGVDSTFLNLVRGKEFKIESIFDPFKTVFIKSILASLLQWLYIMLWSLLFIIPGIIMGIAYSQITYILKDQPELSITELLALSKKMMSGYKWKYFTLMLGFIGLAFLCILTLGIGFLWLSPYISATTAKFYNDLRETYCEENPIECEEQNDETNF